MISNFVKVAIAFFVIAGLVLLLTPKTIWPSFYDLPYMGWAALACAVLIYIVSSRLRAPMAIILFLNASGDLGFYELYKYGFEYDKVIHLFTPMLATVALARYFGIHKAVLVVVVASFGWELFEYLSDALIKTHLFGVFRQHIWLDTTLDLVMNGIGVILGSWIFYHTDFGERSTEKSQTVS